MTGSPLVTMAASQVRPVAGSQVGPVTAGHQIRLQVNGTSFEARVDTRTTLAELLRVELGLTGTHVGCEHGVCGVCTVVVDGKAMRSCLMLAVQADGAEVTTVEGLAGLDGTLHPIQQAFAEEHGLQCGFCTPGVLMAVQALAAENPGAGEEELREVLGGQLCRCTGYHSILRSALRALADLRDAAGVRNAAGVRDAAGLRNAVPEGAR